MSFTVFLRAGAFTIITGMVGCSSSFKERD